MRRRRLLTVVDSLGRGSVERLVVTLHGRLSRRRFDLRVATLHEPSDLARELRDMKVPVYELGLSGPRDLVLGTLKLRRLISAMGIDIVHTHRTLAGVVGRLAAWGKAPVVSTLHDTEGFDGDGSRRRGVLASLDRLTAKRIARKLLAVSHASQEEHERLGLDGTEVLYHCLEVDAFRARVEKHDRGHVRTAYGIGRAETVFLHVGRFQQQKGQDLLLRAFRVALTEQPELRLLLAGDGPTLSEARGLAEELDLQDAVVFLGDVEDASPLYRAADAFVLPSRREPSAVELLEAMAAGLPAVVSETGAASEVATEATAIFADATREEELARGMLALGRHPELRRRLGEGARRRASAFDVSTCIERLEAIYEELA